MALPEHAQPLAAGRPAVRVHGWPIVGWATLGVALLCLVGFAANGAGVDGVRSMIRTSAKTSLLFFLSAFVASSARAFWRNDLTKWLLANRRYVGVSFAASHALHLAAIVALVVADPKFVPELTALIGGGIAYLFLAAMTVTSFDRTAAWLGPRWWKRLHKSGMYYNWIIFFISYLPRSVIESVWYAPFAAALAAGIALRFAAWRRARVSLSAR